MRRYLVLVILAAFALAACEGARNNTSWSKAKEGASVKPPLTKAEAEGNTAAPDSADADTSQVK